MKKIVSLMILLIFTVPSVFSALPQNQFGKNSPKELIKDKSIAYSINYFDAINNVYKNMNISYVSSDKLNKNQIHIKTKSLQSIDKNGNITLGKGASSILSSYGSFKARQPFGTDKKSIQSVEKIVLNRILEINYSNESA